MYCTYVKYYLMLARDTNSYERMQTSDSSMGVFIMLNAVKKLSVHSAGIHIRT